MCFDQWVVIVYLVLKTQLCLSFFALYYDHKDALMQKVPSSSIVKTPDNVIFALDAFKNHLKMTLFHNWRYKPTQTIKKE